MKSIGLVSKKLSTKNTGTWQTRLAKKTILSMLEKVSIGHLTVEDDGEVYSYGEDINSAYLVAHIQVLDQRVYSEVLFGGTIGSGEAYMLNYWCSPNLVDVVRLMVLNQNKLRNMDSQWSWARKKTSSLINTFRKNTKSGSRKNISAHYDLSNDFFKLFLDENMMYSSAIYNESTKNLEQASFHKLDHICRSLSLNEDDHLLEIGTGWGGMAIHAAKYYGCKVTTTTISKEQYTLAKERVRKEGLDDKITLLMDDYRDLEGQYDKLVSVEMIEAVGYAFFDTFFKKCSSLLKDTGVMLIQAITTPDQRYEAQKDETDFIKKYIFPGGCLASNLYMHQSVERVTDMQNIALYDITLSYAKTLGEWRQRFWHQIDDVKSMGFDDVFIRMWDFYLCFCEGGFQERVINTAQYVFAKPMYRDLPEIK